jgi:hypothetical protein
MPAGAAGQIGLYFYFIGFGEMVGHGSNGIFLLE